ncbi:hypothetical protein K402DRAFT_392475 [Aulographum hederae CBS 113979]|uniref:Tyrosine specific protein phosphatases domain-containing protein n=1 Tax=Aulographum hederae CBS 113979 TaxID=1176131 RepID=A0A6G1H362_9PEZI|nr:hypothetical protein K402DRAFT_392475 [Aulographum hederae CBS 113979]
MASMQSPFASLLNFRDVGKTINSITDTELLKTGKLFRSARPDEASSDDRARLVTEYGVKTIIDLRTTTELIEQARKRDARIKSSAAVPHSNDDIAEPLKIPGIDYREINFNGSGYSKALIKQLSWPKFVKLLGLMAFGYRVEAIAVLGTNVMRQRGLVGLAVDSLDACGSEVKEVFSVLADPGNYPLVIHCTQGKDRTGLTVLLTLMLLGVPSAAMKEDYMRSEGELLSERESRLVEIRQLGLGDDFAACDPEFVGKIEQHIKERYGSIEQYLRGVGVGQEMQKAVRSILSANPGL